MIETLIPFLKIFGAYAASLVTLAVWLNNTIKDKNKVVEEKNQLINDYKELAKEATTAIVLAEKLLEESKTVDKENFQELKALIASINDNLMKFNSR
jgi:hypothetical protein